MKIGIIGAMENEVALIKESAHILSSSRIAAMEFVECELNGRNVVVVQCGMGKVNAGICAHTLIHIFKCDVIINSGVAGSLDSKMNIGDFVVSIDASQHDYDASPIGFHIGEIPYTGKYAFPADPQLVEAAKEALKAVASDKKIYLGRICSGDQFIVRHEDKERIVDNYGGLCCEMEGAAVAQACYLSGVRFVIIRCISDKPDGSAIMDFETFSKEAAVLCSKVVKHLVEHI